MSRVARWSKEPREKGLAATFRAAGLPYGHYLKRDGEVIARVTAVGTGGFMQREVKGWSWYGMGVKGGDSGLFPTPEEAKADAKRHYEEWKVENP